MTTFQPSNSNAVFLPTTIQYPKDPQELLERLNKAYEDTATRLNVKQIGIFDLLEFLTGEQWFTSGDPQKKRQTFRKTFELPAIAPGVFYTVAHGLTGVTAYTHIYGTVVTNAPDFRPIPYADVTSPLNQIALKVDGTNITVAVGATSPAVVSGIVVLEYLKN